MNPYRTLCLPLIFSLLIQSCGPSQKIGKPGAAEMIPADQFLPLGKMNETLLFKASINFMRKDFSGLFLVKRNPGDTSTYVVFLSEIGLSLLELKYQNDVFEVMDVQEILNKRGLIKTLQKDFRTLLMDLPSMNDYTVTCEGAEGIEVMRFRHKSKRYAYYYSQKLGVYRIEQKSIPFSKMDITIDHKEPMGIEIDHRGLKPDIVLKQIKNVGEIVD
jgi:hypothetical protein